MRSISRFSQLVRGFSTNVSKSSQPSAPADPLKNVVGKLFLKYPRKYHNQISID